MFGNTGADSRDHRRGHHAGEGRGERGPQEHKLIHYDEERVEVGDWVLIHVGFAMSKLDEEEAHLALQALKEIGDEYEQELEELKTSRIE